MKKAAPAKESGLQNMPADYSQSNNAHVQFIQNELLPSITRHARNQGDEPTLVALAVFLSLSSALENNGMPRSVLAELVATSPIETHCAPEALQ
ncbi:hypothetical protein [Stutzerimonas zhaodongensis]|uniref:hypothetical protein n=1 Tax=Stutzerimonas zhaodongensis TaxID=1176257 RepID=UPI002103943A|nr:hypothetical protein [Stutzerimonas zhaodongensis]MCQ2028799.1 hypothetical protein [Stutzerimonas zhaodongensis]